MRAAIYAAILCTLLALATSASAESVWLFWTEYVSRDGSSWDLDVLTYKTKEECERHRAWVMAPVADARYVRAQEAEAKLRAALGIMDVKYRCLPDTVDPRGPKEK